MNKRLVQEQFGANATAYVNSPTHAGGPSLARLVQCATPEARWRVLDVATGTGHTAMVYAPHVSTVVGLDLTPAMLRLAAHSAAERGLTNIAFTAGDVDDMPFDDAAFDLVTCRIAPHHFADIGRFIAEAVRVLRPGGLLAVVDNIVPGSRLRGKKADRQREAGAYVNAIEKLRDFSHIRCLSDEEWIDQLQAGGLTVETHEIMDKRLTFEIWAARHTPEMRTRLRVMLTRAPAIAAEFLDPQTDTGVTIFRLREVLLIGRKKA